MTGDQLVYAEARSRSASRDLTHSSRSSSRASSRGSVDHKEMLNKLRDSADPRLPLPSIPSKDNLIDDIGNSPRASDGSNLTPWVMTSFSLGHFQNDAFSSLWFTYLLLYLEGTLNLPPRLSAVVLLTGQIFDAMATPVAGLISDAGDGTVLSICGAEWHMCPRTKQHFYGTAIATAFFACVWILPPPPLELPLKVAYYSLSAGMFNVGWAWVQVNHLR